MNICDEKRNCCIAQTELYARIPSLPSEIVLHLQNADKPKHWRGFPWFFAAESAPVLEIVRIIRRTGALFTA